MFSPLRAFATSLGAVVLAGSAWATCTPIADPEPVAGLEQFKAFVLEGKYNVAMLPFEISDAAKEQLAGGLAAVAADGFEACTTIKRVRQSDHFISEVFMTESESSVLYWTISGQIKGSTFRMINFTYNDEFESIRELIH